MRRMPVMVSRRMQFESILNKIDNLDSLQTFIDRLTEIDMKVRLDTDNVGIVNVRLRYYSLQFNRALSLGAMAAAGNADIYLRYECRYIAEKALEMMYGLDKMMEEANNEAIHKTV